MTYVEYGYGLCRWINLIENPVAAHANAQQISAAVRERPRRTPIVGKTIRGMENLS